MENKFQRTALHMAASNEHFEVVRFLLDEGADIEAKCESGEMALHKASASGHVQVVKHFWGEEPKGTPNRFAARHHPKWPRDLRRKTY